MIKRDIRRNKDPEIIRTTKRFHIKKDRNKNLRKPIFIGVPWRIEQRLNKKR